MRIYQIDKGGAKAIFLYIAWTSGDAVVSLAGGAASLTTLIANLTNVATTMDVGSSGLVNGANYFLQTSTQYEVVTVTSTPTAITGGYRGNADRLFVWQTKTPDRSRAF